jgi:hypothetical protein
MRPSAIRRGLFVCALAIAPAIAAAAPPAPAAAVTATAPGPPVAPASSATAVPPSSDTASDAKPAVVVWPTLTPVGDLSAQSLHRPQLGADKDVFERAQELDATLRDAVQDLGFSLDVSDPGPAPGHARDEDLLERASRAAGSPAPDGTPTGTWVVSPRIEPAGGSEFVVRIVAVPPQGRELHVRVETVAADSVGVRGLVMLRDLLSPTSAARAVIEREREQAAGGTAQGIMSTLRSQGRAVLAVNAGLFGGFSAYSVQRASGSTDPRVLYPLLALGTGVGVGAALLAADEWDVTTGDAWFVSAGGWWGTTAGWLIVAGHGLQPSANRFSWGVGGGLIGAGLATFAVTRTAMDDGDGILAHSGGALGLLLGGATELLYRGSTINFPYIGTGYGAAVGLLAAGTLATRVTVSPSRVLLLDVGVGGGGLIGAALASPLIFQNVTPGNTRGWLGATIGGAVAGGVVAWLVTRDAPPPKRAAWLDFGRPGGGVIGASPTRQGDTPIYGIDWSGEW